MSYLGELATEISKQIPEDLLPGGDTALLFRLYALLALVKGTRVTAADVHNAWATWMEEHDPYHRAIRPFKELDTATQASDEPFVIAIRSVAEHFDLNSA